MSLVSGLSFATLTHFWPGMVDSFKVVEDRGEYHKIFIQGWPFSYVTTGEIRRDSTAQATMKFAGNGSLMFAFALGLFLLIERKRVIEETMKVVHKG